jgi:hypothetical protein
LTYCRCLYNGIMKQHIRYKGKSNKDLYLCGHIGETDNTKEICMDCGYVARSLLVPINTTKAFKNILRERDLTKVQLPV